MRIMLIHPNYHSGGAEIAGNWPPAWVAYLAGSLKNAGFTDVVFVDAMTNHLSDDEIRAEIEKANPDMVGTTAITPSIYKAERVLEIAKEVNPEIVTVIGGVHATFMYKQVLSEAPWIDVVVRGEGEEIIVDLCTAVLNGRWPQDRNAIRGLAFREGDTIVASPAAPTVKNVDAISPDWSLLEWEKYIYIPLGVRVAIDDAGTGHNGLAAIKDLGAATLKIDKLFVDRVDTDQRSRALAEMLVQVARELDMGVVAEGVERPEQAAALLAIGVREAQGYLFGRPTPLAAFAEAATEAQEACDATMPRAVSLDRDRRPARSAAFGR